MWLKWSSTAYRKEPQGEILAQWSQHEPFNFYQKIARISDKNPSLFRCQKSPGRPWVIRTGKNRRECGLDARASRCALGYFWYVDDSKARKELDWEPRDPLQTLEDTIKEIKDREDTFRPGLKVQTF